MSSDMRERGAVPGLQIRRLDGGEFLECLPLSARRFGFTPEQQIPAWLIQTMAWCGGVALGAFLKDRVIGYSVSMPGWQDDRRFLMSCGLAVEKQFESRGVGMALKQAQRKLALAAGYEFIKWTTPSVASRQLYVYLNKLGARLTHVQRDMYVHTLGWAYPDEVELRWPVKVEPEPAREVRKQQVVTRSQRGGDGVWRVMEAHVPEDGGPDGIACLVEIPWERDELAEADPKAAAVWSQVTREATEALLASGYVGSGVELDRADRRSFIRFERGLRPV